MAAITLVLRYKGFNYTGYYNGDFAGDGSLPALVATDANADATNVEFGIDPRDDTVYSSSTWTDSDEGPTIAQAVADGLSVMVKPEIDFLPARLHRHALQRRRMAQFFQPRRGGEHDG